MAAVQWGKLVHADIILQRATTHNLRASGTQQFGQAPQADLRTSTYLMDSISISAYLLVVTTAVVVNVAAILGPLVLSASW